MNSLSDFDSEYKIRLVPSHFFGGGKYNKPNFLLILCSSYHILGVKQFQFFPISHQPNFIYI